MVSAKQLVYRFYNEAWNRADENVARLILNPDFEFCALSTQHLQVTCA
jgi:hypothetical protein